MKQSTKNKIGATIGGVGMFLATALPAAAQDNQPARAPYNPRVGDSATATVLNTWNGDNIEGRDQDIVLIDVDGDGSTTDDQRLIITRSDVVKSKPQYVLKTGDRIIYIEDTNSIIYKRVYASDMQRTR
jgi:hypothetical protein